MPELVGYLLLFLVVGAGFILIHLLAGMLVRPIKPHADKLTIYECGEPTIGSAWVQFDVRFYVIALLFVIFDVEVAFFFPWAVVFGKTTELGQANLPEQRRIDLNRDLSPLQYGELLRLQKVAQPTAEQAQRIEELTAALNQAPDAATNSDAARRFSWIAFVDILVFFGVLLVGFAYLWKRGDLMWVRSFGAEQGAMAAVPPARPTPAAAEPLVSAH